MKRLSLVSLAPPNGPARAVFPAAPRSALVTIAFRDTNGKSLVTHQRSGGPAITWYTAHVSRDRIAERLGYWLVSVRVGASTLGGIRFMVPNYGCRVDR